jgi:isochorismate synthase
MERTLLQVTMALPSRVAAEALFASVSGPRTLWEPRESAAPSLSGVGAAHRLDARGPGRFADLRAAAEELFETIEDVRGPGCDDAPPAALLGGLAFSPRARWAAPWTAFGDGSFVLPRWLLVTSAARTFVRLVAPAREGLAGARARLGHFAARLATARVAVRESNRQGATVATARKNEPGELGRKEVRPGVPGGSSRPNGIGASASGPGPRRAEAEVEHMAPGAWRSLVVDALRRIADHELDKLVAARCSVVRTRTPIDVLATLARLRGPAQPGVLFAHERDGATFLGLSPERLVARRGTRVETEALAGTGADPAALAASEKDLREHAIVVDGIRRALQPLCTAIDATAAPRIRSLPGLCHLWTPLSADLVHPTHVLELVQRLHPTPAVAGAPATAAVAWIGAHEPVPRGWYAGPVGWFDARGDGDFAVAIRSGVVDGTRAFIWAGAGIVPASDPDREYGETQAKQRALLGALGVTA